jgi:hypothetical protein
LVELENEYDCNFSIFDVPVQEMEDVYNRMIDDRNALREDATAALLHYQMNQLLMRRKQYDLWLL